MMSLVLQIRNIHSGFARQVEWSLLQVRDDAHNLPHAGSVDGTEREIIHRDVLADRASPGKNRCAASVLMITTGGAVPLSRS